MYDDEEAREDLPEMKLLSTLFNDGYTIVFWGGLDSMYGNRDLKSCLNELSDVITQYGEEIKVKDPDYRAGIINAYNEEVENALITSIRNFKEFMIIALKDKPDFTKTESFVQQVIEKHKWPNEVVDRFFMYDFILSSGWDGDVVIMYDSKLNNKVVNAIEHYRSAFKDANDI